MKILTALFVPNNKGKRCSKNIRETYFNSEHTIDFCVVKVFMVLLETKKKFPKLRKRPWVRNDYIPNEQRCILLLETSNVPFVVRNKQRCKNVHGVVGNNEHFSDKKISQRYCLLTVWNSDLFSICFFGQLDFFFSGDITKISGNVTQVSGDMTLGRLDRLPMEILLARFQVAFKSWSIFWI